MNTGRWKCHPACCLQSFFPLSWKNYSKGQVDFNGGNGDSSKAFCPTSLAHSVYYTVSLRFTNCTRNNKNVILYFLKFLRHFFTFQIS